MSADRPFPNISTYIIDAESYQLHNFIPPKFISDALQDRFTLPDSFDEKQRGKEQKTCHFEVRCSIAQGSAFRENEENRNDLPDILRLRREDGICSLLSVRDTIVRRD